MRLELPKTYDGLTLRALQRINTTSSRADRVSAVTGKSVNEILKMPLKLVQAADDHINDLLQKETQRHLEVFDLNGVTYGFIPNWDEFTAGEWIDLDGYCNDFWHNAHKIMSVLFRPVEKQWGDRYTISEYTAKEDAEVFLDMPADQVAGALLFFSTTRNELLTTTKSCLMKRTTEAMLLLKNGGGTLSSMNWLMRTYYRLKVSLVSLWVTSLRTWPSSKT